jgi:hypothetical protein
MSATSFAGSDVPVRGDHIDAHERARRQSPRPAPGSPVRSASPSPPRSAAPAIAHCARIKAALAQRGPGRHETLGTVGAAAVESSTAVATRAGWRAVVASVLARSLAEGKCVGSSA